MWLTWFGLQRKNQLMRNLWSSLRFRHLLVVFLAIFPGFLLMIHSIMNRQNPEIFMVLLTGAISLLLAWLGGNVLINRRVKALLALAKRLSAGDLTARSGFSDYFSLLGELAQAFDQMADSLEERDRQLHQHADEFTTFVELMNELALQQDPSALLQVIAEKAKMLLKVSNVTILLYDFCAR